MALEIRAVAKDKAVLPATAVVGWAAIAWPHNPVAQRIGPGRHVAVLSIRQGGRRARGKGNTRSATAAVVPARRSRGRGGDTAQRLTAARIRLSLSIDELAAGIQDRLAQHPGRYSVHTQRSRTCGSVEARLGRGHETAGRARMERKQGAQERPAHDDAGGDAAAAR